MSWVQKQVGDIVELRNTYSREVPYSLVNSRPARGQIDRTVFDYGQILVKVTLGGVRLSMNGPCNMTPSEWEEMYAQIGAVQEQLREEKRRGAQTD